MKTIILNTWKSSPEKLVYYEPLEPIYKNGDWSIYIDIRGGYIYAFKNIAVNILVGKNEEHLNNLANNTRPIGKYNSCHFLFDRALDNLKTGLELIKLNK